MFKLAYTYRLNVIRRETWDALPASLGAVFSANRHGLRPDSVSLRETDCRRGMACRNHSAKADLRSDMSRPFEQVYRLSRADGAASRSMTEARQLRIVGSVSASAVAWMSARLQLV